MPKKKLECFIGGDHSWNRAALMAGTKVLVTKFRLACHSISTLEYLAAARPPYYSQTK